MLVKGGGLRPCGTPYSTCAPQRDINHPFGGVYPTQGFPKRNP